MARKMNNNKSEEEGQVDSGSHIDMRSSFGVINMNNASTLRSSAHSYTCTYTARLYAAYNIHAYVYRVKAADSLSGSEGIERTKIPTSSMWQKQFHN